MTAIIRQSSLLVLFLLCLLGHTSAFSHGEAKADWIHVGGNVDFEGIPLCALVLINGQSQFSCDGNGRYDMEVPADQNGMITVQVFVDGFAPFNQIVTPDQAAAYPVAMVQDQGSPSLDVGATYEPSATEGRLIVSGSITIGGAPVCALVLANGQKMFSCGDDLGKFALDVPLDEDRNVTLMVFAAGFQPYKEITEVDPDSDGDGIKDRFDEDDDNDGILDGLDDCPNFQGTDCRVVEITDTIFVDGREWAQVYLFNNVFIDDINAVCPDGFCDGILKAGFPDQHNYDLTGWQWASTDEVNTLFNHYIEDESSFFGPGADEYQGLKMRNMFEYGWLSIFGDLSKSTSRTGFEIEFTGLTSTQYDNPGQSETQRGKGVFRAATSVGGLVEAATFFEWHYADSNTGAFIYRRK